MTVATCPKCGMAAEVFRRTPYGLVCVQCSAGGSFGEVAARRPDDTRPEKEEDWR